MLSLPDSHFSDHGFLGLKGQNTLKGLAAGQGNFELTDAGLIHLKEFKNLSDVDLRNSKITAQWLDHLKGMPSLKRLRLAGTTITDKDLEPFRQDMPNVSVIK